MRRYYISDHQGNIRFTTTGLAVLTRLFAKQGIDIHKIRTRRDYVKARLTVRPDFLLEKWLRETPDESAQQTSDKSPDHQLLMEAIFGNHSPEEFQRMISKNKKRSLFQVVDGSK